MYCLCGADAGRCSLLASDGSSCTSANHLVLMAPIYICSVPPKSNPAHPTHPLGRKKGRQKRRLLRLCAWFYLLGSSRAPFRSPPPPPPPPAAVLGFSSTRSDYRIHQDCNHATAGEQPSEPPSVHGPSGRDGDAAMIANANNFVFYAGTCLLSSLVLGLALVSGGVTPHFWEVSKLC